MSTDAIELNTALVRRFLGIADDEFIELTAFVEGRINVAQCSSVREHVRLLAEAERIRGFNGAYMLVNGPVDPRLSYRYEQGRWDRGWAGRATDKDIQQLRAIFLDCDPVRPKGISATEDEQRAARDVTERLGAWLTGVVGAGALAQGSSGNGFFTLVALEPTVPTKETAERISKLLQLLNQKFGTEHAKIDRSTFNAARLMPAPGTWKRKGRNAPERPHRQATFTCRGEVTRVPLEALC